MRGFESVFEEFLDENYFIDFQLFLYVSYYFASTHLGHWLNFILWNEQFFFYFKWTDLITLKP